VEWLRHSTDLFIRRVLVEKMAEPASKEKKVAGGASSAGAASSSAANASNKARKETKTDATRRTLSTGKSGGRRRKKKREQMPEGFEQWPEDDQKYYQEVSALLRDAKATRRQCSMKREHPSRWFMFRQKSQAYPTYQMEMEAYKRAKEIFVPIDKNEQLDLDF
uniref:Uncharacterized protein n=2 Tax=Parascaris univalens TaxID=6257 RepID=A0A915C3U1_PARUN